MSNCVRAKLLYIHSVLTQVKMLRKRRDDYCLLGVAKLFIFKSDWFSSHYAAAALHK